MELVWQSTGMFGYGTKRLMSFHKTESNSNSKLGLSPRNIWWKSTLFIDDTLSAVFQTIISVTVDHLSPLMHWPNHSDYGMTNRCCCTTANWKPLITFDVRHPKPILGNDNERELYRRKMCNRNCNYSKTKRNIQKITSRSCFPW